MFFFHLALEDPFAKPITSVDQFVYNHDLLYKIVYLIGHMSVSAYTFQVGVVLGKPQIHLILAA